MLEKRVEIFGGKEAKRRGVWAVKLAFVRGRGWPDHTMFAPGGRIAFVEYKRVRDYKHGSLQIWVRKKLRSLGFRYAVIKTNDEVRDFFNEWLGETA